MSPAILAMSSVDPWNIYFEGRLDALVPPPPVPCNSPTICDADLAKAVSPATLAVCEQPPSSLEEDPLDPARAMLELFMEQGIPADSDWDGASVRSVATSASEMPNDMLQIRIATRWSNTRQPLPSIDANQAVCPGIDAAVPLLSTQANVPETMKAACPASSVVVPNNEMVPSPFVPPSPDNLVVPPRFVASLNSSIVTEVE